VGIVFHGDLYTYASPADFDEKGNVTSDITSSEWVLKSLEDAEENENIKAIILEVDSYGGQPVAGEEIANALKLAKKPTVGFIRQAGVSAAY
jgi:protease-4